MSFDYNIAKDFGLSFNPFSVNKRKFPSVSFDNSQQILCFYYPGPNDFGQQCFYLEYDHFIIAFNEQKFKHFTPKNDYLNLVDSIQLFSGSKLNERVAFLFDFFTVTPTIVKAAVHQNKKLKRKIKLQPKWKKIEKMLKKEEGIFYC